MAFESVCSLMHTINCHLNSSDISCREILEFAYQHAESLEEIAIRMMRSNARALDIEIFCAASILKHIVESHVSNQQRTETPAEEIFQSFTARVKMIEEEYRDELYKSLQQAKEEDAYGGDLSPRYEMVGLSDQYNQVKAKLVTEGTGFEVFSITGMAGIGKTTLAAKIFEDPVTIGHFDCRVWVNAGRNCRLKQIPLLILAQLSPHYDQILTMEECLKGKRYLIVLDDVWNKYMAYLYGREGLKNLFLDERNGSRVLVTTRLQQQDKHNKQLLSDHCLNMRLLDEGESWALLHENVFSQDESCTFQLEQLGKKIAKKCEGLPLTILTVATLLSKEEKTLQYWSEIANQRSHQIFRAAYSEISKVLLPSYEYLPRCLQMCFLYIGVFPQDHKIPRGKLVDLWSADGFLEPKFSHLDALAYLRELASNNLVMTYQNTIYHDSAIMEEQMKSCGLHSSLWYLSNREAERNKFCHVLNSYSDGVGESIKGHRRLSFHNNVLFGIKDVCESVQDNCVLTATSLQCYGPYHQYQVPTCFGLRSLRVLDALTIRFYAFPMEVLQLVELRYLALTLDAELPASISQLSKLEFLIVGQHLSIKSLTDPLYMMPLEIWNMKRLQHLRVTGSDLPEPCGASLESLLKLSNVSVHSCTDSILKATPNLEKLGIRIELAPDHEFETLSCFDHISHLKELRSFKCVVVNPECKLVPAPLSKLPRNLTKLSLSGMGYPWKEMNKIASLGSLRMLKLQNYAFQGPKWEVEEKGFGYLLCLVIEDADLFEWKFGHRSFPWLEFLSIKHCYNLEKIDGELKMPRGEKIELVECSPLALGQMKKALTTCQEIQVHAIWDDGKLKI